jgi:hypothetical protein
MFQSSGIFHYQVTSDELDYIADWLLYLGAGTQFEKIPVELAKLLKERVTDLKEKL